ncbi:MAG TPA: hypothetical protein VMM93_07740 [Vicinamibacterales bacterium]|nr:hypothetical protein [Vicinamibacterales bacterium]
MTEGTHIVVLDDNEMRGTVREVRSLNADGQLVIVTTRTAEGQTTEAPVVTQTFRKK